MDTEAPIKVSMTITRGLPETTMEKIIVPQMVVMATILVLLVMALCTV